MSERDAWQPILDADGWEVDASDLLVALADGIAWRLLDLTMDTADRAPSEDAYREALSTARRLIDTRTTPPAKPASDPESEGTP